jgi:glycerol-3-phosphate dehydrogenase
MNIVTRQLLPDYGVGIPSKRSSDAVIGEESRLFFITPWKDVSAIGTTHFPYEGDPDDYRVTDREIAEFVDEINESYPPARLTLDDVLYVYSGLTPAEPETTKGEVGRSKHAEIIDHESRDGCEGLISAIGVKYTTSRLVAERVVSLAQKKLRVEGFERKAREVRLPGAEGWAPGAEEDVPDESGIPAVSDLLARYGSRPPAGLAGKDASFSRVFAACAQTAVEREMALNLEDFLLRRNDFAARGKLTEPMVRLAAETMGAKLNWSAAEVEARQEKLIASIRYLAASGSASEVIVR